MPTNPRVFIPQRPLMKNENGEWVSKWDLSSAEKYGIMVPVLSPQSKPHNPELVIAEIKSVLHDYSDIDSIIAIGNPAILSWCVALAAWYNYGKVRVLQWNGLTNDYIPIDANLGMD